MSARGGRFIAFEGGEGTGKSTQARLLAAALARRGIDCVLTREPGGTPGAEAVRTLLLGQAAPPWTMEAEALLFAAARADHVARLIRPVLEAGRWIVSDRFVDSSRAYQGAAGGLGDAAVLDLHRIGSGGLLPDVAVLLTLPADVAAQRLAERDGGTADRIGGRGASYHAAVAAAFERLAATEPERFAVVDGGGDAEQVHARVLAALAMHLPDLR